ncbi:hypothetical protein EXIGLDRAFT_760401 [Exidia glandulosa HHB12029]|uniref:Uncharacterized protein n=1 Tax=Exidia glandulosa HHB12029 TaxID=1314781 RepID=A0A165P8D7_EXIGL|nr:hypothetical protein EXIGLDRAFT_760401 [Exidia glandulosa HHB12029]
MFSVSLVVAVAALASARATKQPDNPWCPAHNWTPEQTKDKRGCYALNPTYPVHIKQQDLTITDVSGAVVSHQVKDHLAPLENFRI